MFENKYPYTDFHELNLDWILTEIKQLRIDMETLFESAIEQSKEYTDEQILIIEDRIAALQQAFGELRADFGSLEAYVNTFSDQFTQLRNYIDNQVTLEHAQTVLLIQENNDLLLREMEDNLNQIKVINYFTGEKISVQEMFNYLAGLHLTDSIDYDTMAARSKTYIEFANMNVSYTNLALHGNTYYV